MDITLMLHDVEHKSMNFSGRVSELLSILKINAETVLITKNEVLVNNEEVLENSDKIKIISVVSGG